jgi:serine/threonine protein kinase
VNSETFLQLVREHGLLDEEQLADVGRRFPADFPFRELTDALVDKGWMTRYQIERICAGQVKGLVLGQYRILEELGRGGFGCVYKAKHLIMNRVVALKVISPEKVDDSRAREWFHREVLASTQFQHANIVMAFDANEVDDTLFLVMEYVDGPNLAEAVKQQGPLPIGLACALMLQAARGLQYAHEKGMVHRDIKPANLLLPRNNPGAAPGSAARREFGPSSADLAAANQVLVKIVDFGLARLHDQGSPNTLMGLRDKGFVGTPDFISPEQARNIHDADIRADLYSLGCTFYFALTGRPPFRGKNPLEIVLQHLEQEPLAMDSLRPEVPPALVSIVRRLMAKKPEQRFQSPGELVAELSFFFGSGAFQAGPTPSSGVVLAPPATRPPAATFHPKTPLLPAWEGPKSAADEVCADQALPRTMVVPAFSLAPSNVLELATPAPASSATFAGDTANSSSASSVSVGAPSVQSELISDGRQGPEFLQLWRQWAAIVDDLVEGRGGSISEAAYGALHADLLRCAQLKGTGENAPAVYGMVESAVAPWLTLRSLHQIDPQTLASLRIHCVQLEQKLNMGRTANRLWPWLAAAFVLVGVFLVVFLITSGGFMSHRSLALSSIRDYATAHPILTLAVTVPPMVLASVYFLSRCSRS